MRRYQGQGQVITSHSIYRIQLLVPALDAWFWHNTSQLVIALFMYCRYFQLQSKNSSSNVISSYAECGNHDGFISQKYLLVNTRSIEKGYVMLCWETCNYMMTSSNGNIYALLALRAGNSSATGEFSSQRPVTRSFDVFFDLRDLRRHRAHYDVIVMIIFIIHFLLWPRVLLMEFPDRIFSS